MENLCFQQIKNDKFQEIKVSMLRQLQKRIMKTKDLSSFLYPKLRNIILILILQ